jgi:hypothetical protein
VRNSIVGAAALLVAAAPLCLCPRSTGAQQPADSLVRRGDSVRRAEPRAGLHQAIVLGATVRSYRIGDTTVNERVGGATYSLSAGRLRLNLDGSALRYAAAPDTISGSLPGSARVDYLLRPGDTVSVFARTASRPGALSSRQTAAVGSAGTSTLDLDAFQLGTPPVGGGGVALAFPVGSLVLGVRGGLEAEPRPTGSNPVYWRGTTVKGGLSLTGASGDNQLTGSVDVSRSSGDSLGGRNLFPGGGTVSLELVSQLSIPSPFDELRDEQWPLRTVVFYSQPFNDTRADQPDRLVPRGSLLGGLASLLLPVGGGALTPSLQLLHESSADDLVQGAVRSRIDASAWTASLGLGATVPLGDNLDLEPAAGYTTGNVTADFTQNLVTRRGRGLARSSGFNDSIRGGWLTLELHASF